MITLPPLRNAHGKHNATTRLRAKRPGERCEQDCDGDGARTLAVGELVGRRTAVSQWSTARDRFVGAAGRGGDADDAFIAFTTRPPPWRECCLTALIPPHVSVVAAETYAVAVAAALLLRRFILLKYIILYYYIFYSI